MDKEEKLRKWFVRQFDAEPTGFELSIAETFYEAGLVDGEQYRNDSLLRLVDEMRRGKT